MLPEMPDRKELGRYFALGQIGLEMVVPIVVGLVAGSLPRQPAVGLRRRCRPGLIGGLVHLVHLLNKMDVEGFLPIRSGVPVIRRLLFLVGGCAAFWLLVGLPARHLGGGDTAVVFLGTALLCAWCPPSSRSSGVSGHCSQTPDKQLMLVLGGTGVRMAFVLLAGWGCTSGCRTISGNQVS